jgi:TIR domain
MADAMRRIFISFVHEDESVASAVKRLLEEALQESPVQESPGALVAAFMSSDQSQVYAGEPWLDKITTALREAEIVLLMFSRRSVGRPWVNFEAGGAMLLGKTVIPCCYGNLNPSSLPHPYGSIQAVHLPRFAYYLVKSVHHHLGLKPGIPTSPHNPDLDRLLAGPQGLFWGSVIAPYEALERTLDSFVDDPPR